MLIYTYIVHLYHLRLSAKSVSCTWARTAKIGADKDLEAGDTQVCVRQCISGLAVESVDIYIYSALVPPALVRQVCVVYVGPHSEDRR